MLYGSEMKNLMGTPTAANIHITRVCAASLKLGEPVTPGPSARVARTYARMTTARLMTFRRFVFQRSVLFTTK